MIAQECPTCEAMPGEQCKAGRFHLIHEHAARQTLEYGVWIHKYDKLYRDKSLKFCCRPYAA